MQYVTFSGGGMFTGIAIMLELMGYEATDRDIALGMEAPYLFVRTEDGFRAGARLAQPQWLNLYLQPRGLHLNRQTIAKQDAPAFLRSHCPALMRLGIQRGIVHPAVFSGYTDGKYRFINIKSANANEPDRFAVSAAALRNRLEESIEIYTINTCTPTSVDFVPLLIESLNNLNAWRDEVLTLRQQEISLADFNALRDPLFRALMQDMQPIIALTNDYTLYEELRRLNHHYRHVFAIDSNENILLSDRLSKRMISRCVAWMKEDIRDRLFELGATEY